MKQRKKTNDNFKKFLEEKKVFKVNFQEVSNPLLGVLFLVCHFIDKKGSLIARGTSICSLSDSFDRKIGKDKAFKRAVKAVRKGKSSDRVREDTQRKISRRKFKIEDETASMEYIESIIPYISKQRKDGTSKMYEISISTYYPLNMAYISGIDFKSEFDPKEIDFGEIPGLEVKQSRRK